MSKLSAIPLSSVLIALSLCAALSAASDPVFEVASIKPNASGGRGMSINRTAGGRFTTENVPLRFLITFAYDVRDFQVTGGPGWLSSDRWDISAKPEGNVPAGMEGSSTIRAMLRALLADRFKLVIGTETKEMPVYALVAGKNGPKLQASPPESKGCSIRSGRGQTTFTKCSVATLAENLSSQVGRTVIDETGLKGDFDFKLEFAPDQGASGKPPEPGEHSAAVESDSPTIFTALQEQLGLRLEGKKGPVKILVVEKAEKATEN